MLIIFLTVFLGTASLHVSSKYSLYFSKNVEKLVELEGSYKSYQNHKDCNDNVKYEMSVSESRDLDKIEDGLAKLRNEVAIALVNVKETVEDIHDTIRFLWERISHLADVS